jgi:hypothetical protein
LATGAGDIRERLFLVFQDLCFLAEADFPDHLRSDWLWIVNQMTRYGPLEDHRGNAWRGSLENTMKRIRRMTGVRIAKRLLQLRDSLRDHLFEQRNN